MTPGRLFGTDGVRGLANRDLTAELALDLSVAAAHVLGDVGELHVRAASGRPLAVVGRDTRASGEFLSAAVVAGLASAGVDVFDVGVLPTPAVAYLVDHLDADLGVMLSASHNPMPDNGIKFFARGGVKLADALEDAIEQRMREPWDRPTGSRVGRITTYADGEQVYVSHLLSTLPSRLDGLTVVVDGAHGAAYNVSPEAMRRAGATVITVGCEPDGLNINDGIGSTHLSVLQEAVVRHGADVGIAHDGDADRCLAVDASGVEVDGDQILAILALAMHESGSLAHGTVVATVMSNLGFKRALDDAGLKVVETAVGDRYVLEAMNESGFNLGGEQSGHVILADHATTGDGTLTALHLLAQVASSGRSLAELATAMTRFPQVLVNVRDVDRSKLADSVAVHGAVAAAEARLGASGRVLLRSSGTEPLVRVMVEAATLAEAEDVADDLAEVVRASLA